MERPFVFMTIPFIIGIILAYYFNFNIITTFIIINLFLAVYILKIVKRNGNAKMLFLIFVILGILISSYNLKGSILISNIEKNLILKGRVHELVWKDEEEAKYIVIINSIQEDLIQTKVEEKTVLKVIGNRMIEIGDEITFTGKLKLPIENTNPKLFNYRLSLLSNKIYTSITVKDYSIIKVNDIDKPFKYKIKSKFKEDVENVFDNNLNQKNSSLMKSIVLGEYSYLEEENIERYRELGLAHILAVSGVHIGIIAGFLIYLFSHLGIKRKTNVVITLSIIWFYGFLIGFPPSLLRANIMFSILFYAQILAEPYDSINSLFISMFVLLLINPMWIFNLGFQLSFSATFSIIYITPKIKAILYPYNNKIIYSLAALLSVQIGLLPIQAYYFNNISLLSIISNLIIAPILSLSLVLGGIMVGLSYLFPIANIVVGGILNFILSFQFNCIDIIYSIPFRLIKIHSPSIVEMILYYILILTIFKVINLKKLKSDAIKSIIYYLIIMVLWNSIILVNDKSIEIHFVDVGQGDCIFVRTARKDYLIDTGGSIMDSFDVGKSITLPYLQKLGVTKLDGVFITHFDDDHCKSLPLLIDNIKVENVLASYEDSSNEIYNKVVEKAIPIAILKEKDLIWLDNQTSIEILSPNKDLIDRDLSSNNLSLVFLLSYYDKEILFTGDMEKEIEIELVDKIENNIDMIKIPHHGSLTSSTEGLLNKVKPQIGIISVGRNNFYGHPNKEVIDRYEDLDTKLYRTDTMGMIKIKLNKEDIQINTFVKEKLSLIKLLDENLLVIVFYIIYYLISYILSKRYLYLEEEMIIYEL